MLKRLRGGGFYTKQKGIEWIIRKQNDDGDVRGLLKIVTNVSSN